MDAWWYYSENGETIGPTSVLKIANWIRQAKSRTHFVWTEGMSEWTDASTVPEFLTAFQAPELARAPDAKVGAETKTASAATRATLAQRARRELIQYLWISAYLWVCFGALIFYKAAILHSQGVEFTSFGLAIVKALILGKFILVLQALKIGDGAKHGRIVLVSIIKKSFIFMLILFVLTIIEEQIVGHIHGRTSREILRELAGGTLAQAFSIGVLMFLILIPYFAFHEIAARLGEGELLKLLIERRSAENDE